MKFLKSPTNVDNPKNLNTRIKFYNMFGTYFTLT